MQPAISPQLLQQLEPFISSNLSLQQLLESAISNYISWQNFLSGFAPGESANAELERKFNHLLIQTEQAQADLRSLIKESNDRIDQAWQRMDAIVGRQNHAPLFNDVEVEVLRRFSRSMGAAATIEPLKVVEPPAEIFPPVEDPECADGVCPMTASNNLEILTRPELSKLLTQHGIAHRHPEGRVWRVDEMRSLLADKIKQPIQSTETKRRRGRPKKEVA
jgi:hypothetical protein